MFWKIIVPWHLWDKPMTANGYVISFLITLRIISHTFYLFDLKKRGTVQKHFLARLKNV